MLSQKVFLTLPDSPKLQVQNNLFLEDSDLLRDLKDDFDDFEQEAIHIEAPFKESTVKAMLGIYDFSVLELQFKFDRVIGGLDPTVTHKLLEMSDFFGLGKFRKAFFGYMKREYFDQNVEVDEDNFEFKEASGFFAKHFDRVFTEKTDKILREIKERDCRD